LAQLRHKKCTPRHVSTNIGDQLFENGQDYLNHLLVDKVGELEYEEIHCEDLKKEIKKAVRQADKY
jgi:hypothetical protein